MANFPKKASDPTEAALSAIQEALNIKDFEQQPAARAPAAPGRPDSGPAVKVESYARPRPPAAPPAAPIEDAAFPDEPHSVAPPSETPRLAANDDRQTIGQILQTLQPRPAGRSNLVATGLALVWV